MANQRERIGAVWIRPTRDGAEFMSGSIEVDGKRIPVVIFRNGYRTDANRQPHYHVFRDTPPPPGSGDNAPRDEHEALQD